MCVNVFLDQNYFLQCNSPCIDMGSQTDCLTEFNGDGPDIGTFESDCVGPNIDFLLSGGWNWMSDLDTVTLGDGILLGSILK